MASKKSAAKKPAASPKRPSKRPVGKAPSRKVAKSASTTFVPGYKPAVTTIEAASVRAWSKFGGWDSTRQKWAPFRFAEMSAKGYVSEGGKAEVLYSPPEIAVLDALALAVEGGGFPECRDNAARVRQIFSTQHDLRQWAEALSEGHENYWLHDRHFRALFELFAAEEGFTSYPEVARSMLEMADD